MARWRLAEPYEDIDDGAGGCAAGPRDICSYYGITDAANIDFDELWALAQRHQLR